ncbi:MAG: signal peptidase II [Oscillospiraceae bacterium]|nr:signal peptidase II [Oscillospiraceae bacterium]
MLYAILAVLVIIADQWIKYWTMGNIPLNSFGDTLIPGVLSMTNVHNEGAAFGFLSGSGARIPFIILAGVFTLVVIIALATNLISGKLARLSIVLVTAGGLSNCIDRVIYGYVQDMFSFDFISFPVFNLADVFITVFAVVFALAVIFGKSRKKDKDDYDDWEEEDDYEEPPRKSRAKAKKEKKRSRRDRDEDEWDEDEDGYEEKPVRKKSRNAKKPADEEEVAAVSRPSVRKHPAAAAEPAEEALPETELSPVRRKAAPRTQKAADGEDPFAAWDSANAKKAAAAPKAAPARQPAQSSAAAPVRRSTPAAAKPAAPAAQPAARSAAAAKPAAKPAPKAAPEEEFSLEDILNEFR